MPIKSPRTLLRTNLYDSRINSWAIGTSFVGTLGRVTASSTSPSWTTYSASRGWNSFQVSTNVTRKACAVPPARSPRKRAYHLGEQSL